MAGGGLSVFGGVSRAGHRSARRARRVASVLVVLVGRYPAGRDTDRRSAGRDLWPEPRLPANGAGLGPDLAEYALRGNRPSLAAAGDPRPRPGALQPGSGRLARRAITGGAELHPGVAANDRADRRNDRDLRDCLRRLSAPGD